MMLVPKISHCRIVELPNCLITQLLPRLLLAKIKRKQKEYQMHCPIR